MRVLLVNPPHTAIGSRIPEDHLPPLGLLAVGGPLLDAGHRVGLLDADLEGLPLDAIVERAAAARPEALLLGHSGSTSAHPTVSALTRRLRARLPDATIVYGGVFPTFHWREVLETEPQIDVIVRGEGEATAVALLEALSEGRDLAAVRGLAFRARGEPVATAPAPLVRDLDACRVGWELVDHRRYGYWGGRRAVVVQLSRGCPHRCTYCGQSPFWRRWRHRDPVRLAAEIARLHREQGVEVFDFADESPLASREVVRAFLDAMIAEDVQVTLVASARADDIVRDRDILHLYRQAGFERFLIGMESTDAKTLRLVRKGGSGAKDREAIRLLRRHGIISLATWVVGFTEETDRDLVRGLAQVLAYDPDQIQTIYATPHRWTRYFDQAAGRRVVQPDLRKWDYKHQVLENRNMSPCRLLAWVKLIEAVVQLRPRALARLLAGQGPAFRHGMRWYYGIGRRVWLHEVLEGLLDGARGRGGPTLEAFWGGRPESPEAGSVLGFSLPWGGRTDAGGRAEGPAPSRRSATSGTSCRTAATTGAPTSLRALPS